MNPDEDECNCGNTTEIMRYAFEGLERPECPASHPMPEVSPIAMPLNSEELTQTIAAKLGINPTEI